MNRTLTLDYLWTRRSFVHSLVYKDIKNRYAHSMLGVAWMVLEPLLLVAALSLIFSRVGRLGQFTGAVPFPVFFYAGILPWNLFSRSLSEGTKTFVAEAVLLRKYSFPREILLAKNLVIFLIELAISSVAFCVVLALFDVAPNVHWLWLPPLLALECALCFGVMLVTASLNVYLRDVATFLGAISGILFWVSPVVFRIDPSGPSRLLLYLNPIAGILESVRAVIIDGTAPTAAMLVGPAVWTIALLTAGYAIFRRLEAGFVDAL